MNKEQEAIALLQADLVWSTDFEAVRPILLKMLTDLDAKTTRLALVNALLGESNA